MAPQQAFVNVRMLRHACDLLAKLEAQAAKIRIRIELAGGEGRLSDDDAAPELQLRLGALEAEIDLQKARLRASSARGFLHTGGAAAGPQRA